MTFDHELIEKVTIAVIAAFSKDVIRWVIKRSPSVTKKLTTMLAPMIIALIAKYWTFLIDVLYYGFMWVMLSPYLRGDTPPSRMDVFMISFFTAFMVIWMARRMDETRTKTPPN